MDLWDDINPYASSSDSRYGNPVPNFGTPDKTNASQTSQCIGGPADKSSPRTHNHPLNNAIQEGELSCSRSAQSRWEKTNKYVCGISCASTKNSTICTRRERPSSYTAQCQWKNEEVPPGDTYGKDENSYRSPSKNKNDCNSRNNVAAERASGLPTESRLECRRSLSDMDYDTETELQTKDYHSGKNHNNVAEPKLKRGSNCDGLDCVGEIKSDYDNLPEIIRQERDHHDFKKYDYYSDKSDDDILVDRLGKDYSSSEENYVVDMELAKRNNQLKRKYDCEHETQLRRRDADNKKQPEKREELVGIRQALVSLVPGEAALSTLSIPQPSEIQKPLGQSPQEGRKRGNRGGRTFQLKLPSGERLRLKKSDAIALGLTGQKREDVTRATGDKQSENLHDKSNGNKNDQLEKGEDVSHTTDDNVTKSHLDKKYNYQDKNCYDKSNRNKKDQLEKEEVSHTADDYVIKSRRDKKDNRQDMNYRNKNNRNKKDELEKREKVSHTADDYVTKSRRDKQDNCQDKNYSDKNNRNKKEELEKREEVSHATDDCVTKSRWDEKDNRDKNYNEDKRNKKDQREKREVSHRTDDYLTKSRWDKNNHRDKNCHDKGKDAVQKKPKIDVIVSKREVEENIMKARMIKSSPAQISDYSNVQSNPTATTLLKSRKCDSNGTQNTVTKTVSENQNNFDGQAISLGQLHLDTAQNEDKPPHKNPNFLLLGSKKKPFDTLNRMLLEKKLAVKLMAEDGVNFLQVLGEKTTVKITVEKQMIKGDIHYVCIFAGPTGQRKLEAQEAVERFLHPLGNRKVINSVPFKSDCSVTSLRVNLRIIDSSYKYWTYLASFRYYIVLQKETLLKRKWNVVDQLDLVKEVQGHYSVLNAMILGKLDVADGPKHMQILRQWLQQSNVNSTMTSTIGFSFNYVFNYDSALEIDYPEVIKRFRNDRKLEKKLKIRTMLRIGTDVCNGRGWKEHLQHHKSLYNAVIISNYSADSIEQFKKNYSQLKEESLKPNSELQIVSSHAVEQKPPQGRGGGLSKQEDDPHATETQHLHCATGGAVELQPSLRSYLSGKRKWQGERNNMHKNKWRKQRVALMNSPLQHQSPPANLLPFPHAQGVVPSQPLHGVNHASVALPYNVIPLPIRIPLGKNLNSFNLMPATAYKLFEPAGDDFLRTLCEQTNLKIDLIKEQGISTVQYICTLQGPDEEKPKAKAAIIKFCKPRLQLIKQGNCLTNLKCSE